MADNHAARVKANWPLVKFYFRVEWDKNELVFQEVTGLESETPVIEYRHGNSDVNATVRMPGLHKLGNITLKKGIFMSDIAFGDLHQPVSMNTFKRFTITISLLDDTNTVKMRWTLINAFPVKLVASDLKSEANEVSIESLELAYEGFKIVS